MSKSKFPTAGSEGKVTPRARSRSPTSSYIKKPDKQKRNNELGVPLNDNYTIRINEKILKIMPYARKDVVLT